jgi:murein DD-endopeptidase MepM/ murein hydrolase activator NlpD
MTAGLEAPNFCPQLNRTVQALLVVWSTRHRQASATRASTDISRIDVQAGASVSEGTVIGLSGNTGCSGTPHLHFGVGRSVAGRYVLIDPYGWHAPTGDRWELDPRGATSVWLWKDGVAPSLRQWCRLPPRNTQAGISRHVKTDDCG